MSLGLVAAEWFCGAATVPIVVVELASSVRVSFA